MRISGRIRTLDYSVITPYLYIGRLPSRQDLDFLKELNIGLVINMRFEKRMNVRGRQVAFQNLWLPAVDTRFTPIVSSKIDRGIIAALETIDQGKVVYVNCKLGRHRSVVMAACILIAKGYDAVSAMKLIKQQRPAADLEPLYIRKQILQYERNSEKTNHVE
jgi:protein-tyrosine phosphatase